MNSNGAFENFLMNVEDLKLINLDGEMLLKLDVSLFILTDRLSFEIIQISSSV